MPVFMEREIQKVRQGKWDELEVIDKKYDIVENKYGFPPKRRYRAYSGAENDDVLVIEREWKSLAKYVEAMYKIWGDPEEQKLNKELEKIIENIRIEMYVVWPLKVQP